MSNVVTHNVTVKANKTNSNHLPNHCVIVMYHVDVRTEFAVIDWRIKTHQNVCLQTMFLSHKKMCIWSNKNERIV